MTFTCLQNKSPKNIKSQCQHLEDLLMREKYWLKDHLEEKDTTMSIQSLKMAHNILRNQIIKSNTLTAVFPQINNLMIYKDNSKLSLNSTLTMLYYQILVAESTSNEKTLIQFWKTPLMAKLRSLLLHTGIGYPDSILNYWKRSLKCVTQNSLFSIKMTTSPANLNWQKIFYQLSTFSAVEKWEREDIPEQKKKNNNFIGSKKDMTGKVVRCKHVRIYPNKYQKQKFNEWIGTCRYLYNDVLNRINKKQEKVSFMGLRNKFVTEKHGEKTGNEIHKYDKWMYNTPKEIRAGAIMDLVNGFSTNFKKGEKFKMKFRSKKSLKETIKIPKSAVQIKDSKVNIYPRQKLENIKIKEWIGNLDSDIEMIKMRPNIWFLSIPVIKEIKEANPEKKICAVDPGSKTFLTGVGTDGNAFKICDETRKVLKRQDELIDKLKSRLDELKNTRKRKEYMKTKCSLYLSLFRKRNLVKEIHRKSVNFLVSNYDIILIPRLKVKKKGLNKHNREMSLFGFCNFINLLENKCEVEGKKVVIVDEHYTSKTCNNCGKINTIRNRVLKCTACKEEQDRDINGAINIFQKSVVEHSFKQVPRYS